jgi:hypothetical protein
MLLAFNRGLISRLAVARIDLKRLALSAETFTNWIPRVFGAMSLRPGWQFISATKSNNAARLLPFVFAIDDTASIELTSGLMRVRVNDELVTRPSVSSAVTNGNFDTNVASWTDNDDAGAVSQWATGGYLSLQGNGTAAAVRDQQITVAAGDQNVEHALRINIYQGECYLRVGSTSGGDEYITETFLYPGLHSLAFTPTGDFYIRIFSREAYPTLVDSINVEAAGVMEIATPWTTSTHLDDIRYDQSGDVIFVACKGVMQKRIERRAAHSWSVVDYITDNGPFRAPNTSPTTITPSALTGAITLTASKPLFRAGHVGALWKLVSSGQNVTASISAEDAWSDSIRVFGVGTDRAFTIVLSGTWTATVTLQRSIGAPGSWTDVTTYVANQTVNYDDGLDNQEIYYRIGVATGDYTSGTVEERLSYPSGSITGFVRITGYTSSTVVSASVLKALGAVTATANWSEGAWSTYRGFPSTVSLHESRLVWMGKDKVWASITDDFIGFDEEFVGDAGPISRSIGSGPVDAIRWSLSMQSLVFGGQGAEWSARSSSLEEPLTPTNFNLKAPTNRGSAGVAAVLVDQTAIFVDRSAARVYELVPDAVGKHSAAELSAIVPEIGEPSVVRLGVQRNPDTRVHAVRSDGKVAMLVYDRNEEVRCWLLVETNGFVEDVMVLPGTVEDQVYYVVRRTVNGATVRYVEKWAKVSEAIGGNVNKQADSFVLYQGAATSIVTGLDHLEGESVVCWADGRDRGTFTVSGGQINIGAPASAIVAGLTYTARFKSTKLANGAQGGSPLSQVNRIDHAALLLADTHAQGLRYGVDFDHLDDLPLIEEGVEVDADTIHTAYNADSVEVNGIHSTDSHLCLEAAAPRPATVLGVVISMTTHDKL